MNLKDVKKNLLQHSDAKVRLLGEYLKKYLNIISNDGYTKTIDIYDLFCGEGLYENGGEGSPLVIMRAIKDLYINNISKSNLMPTINCYFNDLDHKKILKTEKSIIDKSLSYPEFCSIEYNCMDYNNCLLVIENRTIQTRNKKIFVFIDPYEYKHIKINQIKKLLSNRNTEVLLWLPTQFMYRFETNGTPTSLKDFIKELMPYESWPRSKNAYTFVETLKEEFQQSIGNDFFVDNFTIKKDNNTLFCLFFFTPHIKGFEKMLETKWEIDTSQGRGWHYTAGMPSLFNEPNTNSLEEKLITLLENKSLTNGELYEFILRHAYLPKHAKEILTNWQKMNLLEVKLINGENARKKSFYLSYKYYKEDFNKVTITKLK